MSIGTDKTKFIIFSNYKNTIFSLIKTDNNEISDTSVSIFLRKCLVIGLHFKTHITVVYLKVANQLDICIYKLNDFLPETFLKMLNISLTIHIRIRWNRNMTLNIRNYYTQNIFVLQKKDILSINSMQCNENTNTCTLNP